MFDRDIFKNNLNFKDAAWKIFIYQYHNNAVYREYADLLGVKVEDVSSVNQIPFLPIRFFKTHKVISGNGNTEKIFTSSGTTGQAVSEHYVSSLELYRQSFFKGFELFYGSSEEWCILALLPSYLEREGSSLVYMCDELIKKSQHELSGFYLYDYNKLADTLQLLEAQKQKTLLIGVSYALLDLAEKFPQTLKHTVIMETGGMKGRRKEMTKAEMHENLKKAFHVPTIHSEYGMTEMLSQAYSTGNEIYRCPPWMKILVRDSYDPLSLISGNRAGGINVIDLANMDSCSFVATQDLGVAHEEGTFKITGRFDDAEIRGCNLMIE